MALVVGTYNPHFKLRPSVVGRDLAKLIDRTDVQVLGLQEMAREARVPYLEQVCTERGWEYTRPDDIGSQRQTPIAWDDRVWKSVQTGSQRLNEETLAEPGAGGALIESKWATWAVLQRRSDGIRIAVINWHAPATVEDESKVKRREVLKVCVQAVRTLAKFLEVGVDAVFITGDMNANWRKRRIRETPGFPVQVFRDAGFRANWAWSRPPPFGTHHTVLGLSGPTSGMRLIDYVFSNKKVVKTRILLGFSSDHRPVLVTYKV